MCVEVGFNHIPVINFSLQQNHVPVIRDIVVKNTGETDLEDVIVSISFDPDFAEPLERHIDLLPAGKSVELTDIAVNISTSFLSNLTERIEGSIRASVSCDGNTLFKSSYGISLLAFDQWSGLAILPAMLSAFVTPNHPEIVPVLKRASEILGKWTGSSAMDEYQTRDPNRVKMQMAAIYDAISELRIAYSTSPASFEEFGQRIRLYSDIFSGRMATCLDMTLLYAGCLEAVGINPLIVMVKGHAFAGGWLVGETFPDSVNDDVSLLTKRTADGVNEILLVETTCMNEGHTITFDEARVSAELKLRDPDSFILFIDVTRARNARIRPIPMRVMRDGVFEIHEPAPAEEVEHQAPSAMSETQVVSHVDHIAVDKQIIWERKLLDLSLRNNLINTRMTNNTLQLIPANVNELEDALSAGEEFRILPKPSDWDNPLLSAGLYQSFNATHPMMDLVRSELKQKRLYSYLDAEPLRKVLTHLYRSSRLAMEENGANSLYLAVGLLKWFETPVSTRPRFAPILLLPIEIIRKTVAKGYIIRSRDEEPTLNITLLEMLRQNFGIGIGGLDPLPSDGSGVDVQKILNVFRRAVMAQTGWDVEEQVVVGNFSFSKFIMWNDIHRNADKLSRNKIVASLISGRAEWDADDIADDVEEIDLDETYPAGSVALPIGADSSQFRAICEAVAGKSFVLHGPPGTGKSQTITNIIANALYNGKKVLFVAEKMAALQVVQRRLEAIGLAPFCLELHSNKTKKSYILEQLRRTTEVIKKKQSEAFPIKAAQINELRRDLNGYVKALHRKWPAGLSIYDCFARYATLDYDGQPVRIPESVVSGLTRASFSAAEMAAKRFGLIAVHIGNPAHHPLAGIDLTDIGPDLESEAPAKLRALALEIDRYEEALRKLSELLRFGFAILTPEQKEALCEIKRILLATDYIPATLLASAGNQAALDIVRKVVNEGRERDSVRDSILSNFSDDILSWNFNPWEAKWRESLNKWWLPRWLGCRSVRSQIRAFMSVRRDIPDPEVEDIFQLLRRYRKQQQLLDDLGREAAPLLGMMWNPSRGDWDAIETTAEAARELDRQIVLLTGDLEAAASMRDLFCRSFAVGYDSFREMLVRAVSAAVDSDTCVAATTADLAAMLDAGSLATMPLDSRRDTVLRWAGSIGSLHDRATYNRERREMVSLGFGRFVEEVEEGKIEPDKIVACFSKSLCRSYAEWIFYKEPALSRFHGLLYEEKIEMFRRFSRQLEKMTAEELYARLSSSLPALRKEAAQSSEVGILQRNLRNGGRGTSIRRLFDQIPDLLTRMCPCMLMSPISVAQYIDADNVPFDLVIFDEASQMPTSEAVGAIARGRNVIVVGDPRQMPPTTFFTANVFDEDNADKEDMENILEDCLALSMPSRHLLWHYRSRHESLIAFSNANYYENKLLTFPSPDDLTTKVGWQYVEGAYDRGKTRQNRAEAEAVIEEIRTRLADPSTSSRSIGVVTFNSNQQSLIEDLLTDLFTHNPDLEAVATGLDEPIFVKNLENVQGDERDVILFSIGYGPDRTGKVALNFGPLNREGGGRRLNVAVSRARYEMKVFSSLRADDIDLNRTSAEGVADLRKFLEYAEKGRDHLAVERIAGSGSRDSLVGEIAAGLGMRGFEVRTDIGCSGYRVDIGVVDPADPDRYMIGILLDGPNFASAGTAGDRLVTQEAVLRQLGWQICRVWSTDWWREPAKTIDHIVKAIGDAARKDKSTPEEPAQPADSAPAPAPSTDQVEDVEPVKPPKPVKTVAEPAASPRRSHRKEEPSDDQYELPYKTCKLKTEKITSDQFVSGFYDPIISGRLMAVLDAEAPISRSLLCKRVISSLGMTRMGTRVAAYLDKLIARKDLGSTGSDADNLFYWKVGQNPGKYANYRPKSDRDPLDIPPEEITVAIQRMLRDQVSLPVDGLKKEIALTFGFNRMSDNVIASIDRAIRYAIRRKRIIRQDDRFKLPG